MASKGCCGSTCGAGSNGADIVVKKRIQGYGNEGSVANEQTKASSFQVPPVVIPPVDPPLITTTTKQQTKKQEEQLDHTLSHQHKVEIEVGNVPTKTEETKQTATSRKSEGVDTTRKSEAVDMTRKTDVVDTNVLSEAARNLEQASEIVLEQQSPPPDTTSKNVDWANILKVSEVTTCKTMGKAMEVITDTHVKLNKHGSGEPKTFLDLLYPGEGTAISSVENEAPLTYDQLRFFLAKQDLPKRMMYHQGDVVSIVMPNGPELAVTLLLMLAKATAVPLEPALSEQELFGAFVQLNVRHVVCLRRHKVYDDHIRAAASSVNARMHYMAKSDKCAGAVSWLTRASHAAPPNDGARNSFGAVNSGRWSTILETLVGSAVGVDEVGEGWTDLHCPSMLLRTSGTTSKPKIVPLTLYGMCIGSTCITTGLGVQVHDHCLNVMPYTHIGGISCNLLGSLMLGAHVRCSTGFNPATIVDWIEGFQPTWYYAVPTIHMAIRLAYSNLGRPPKHSLRFIRNGAANLADSDARAMRDLFGCVVMPTYSMSECMPIAQPPNTYSLEKPGTVGCPIASSCRITGASGAAQPFGEVGEVTISGPVVTPGYLENPKANAECFFEDEGRRWFRTGDVGYIDEDCYIFLTGRSKELIKRGGEQVSPYEVEEVMLKHPAVRVAVVFGVPNDFWGEEVAAVVVLKDGWTEGAPGGKNDKGPQPRKSVQASSLATQRKSEPNNVSDHTVTAKHIMKSMRDDLPNSKIPAQIRFVKETDIPKTATGKYQRVGTWEKMGFTQVDTKAQNALGAEPIGNNDEQVPASAKPSKALYGVRFFMSICVLVVHCGDFPSYIGVWRNMSVSMPAFFILAGFMLEMSTTRSPNDPRKFFRNRFLAMHPQYMVAMLIGTPIYYIQCIAGAKGFGNPIVDLIWTIALFISSFYAIGGFELDGPTWFSQMYYCNIFIFTWVHRWVNKSQILNYFPNPDEIYCSNSGCIWSNYLIYPVIPFVLISTLVNALIWLFLLAFAGPGIASVLCDFAGVWRWAQIFAIGMMLFKLFELHNRGDAVERRWKGWPFLVDGLSLWFAVGLVIESATVDARLFDQGWDNYQWASEHIQTVKHCMDDSECRVSLCSRGLPENLGVNYSKCLPNVVPDWPDRCYHNLQPAMSCSTNVDALGSLLKRDISDKDVLCFDNAIHVACQEETNWRGVFPGNVIKENPPWLHLAFFWSRPVWLSVPFFCVWIYGLALGEGFTAKLFANKFIVEQLSPASYATYLLHVPLADWWMFITRLISSSWTKIPWHEVLAPDYLNSGWPRRMQWWELLIFIPFVMAFALWSSIWLNQRISGVFRKHFERIYCICPCFCTGVGCGASDEQEEDEDTFTAILEVIGELTGAEPDYDTPLTDIGMDSFGAGALVGALVARLVYLEGQLTATQVYEMDTVGDLVEFSDAKKAGGGA